VPWCDVCNQLRDELTELGACPSCGQGLAEGEQQAIPWRFRLLIVASIVYLLWRAYQGIHWLIHHL